MVTLSNPVLAYQKEHDLLNDIDQQLQKENDDPASFGLSSNNYLPANFLTILPTEQIWGMTPQDYVAYPYPKNATGFALPICKSEHDCKKGAQCKNLNAFQDGLSDKKYKRCIGMADHHLDKIYNAITSAENFVDITLFGFPNGRYQEMLTNAFTVLAQRKKPIQIRIFIGYLGPNLNSPIDLITHHYPITQDELIKNLRTTTWKWLNEITKKIQPIKTSNLTITVAGMTHCQGNPIESYILQSPKILMEIGYNHSKIINIDGKMLLTGGMNMDTNSYLSKAPVFDIMMEIQGEAAAKSLAFTNTLWEYINKTINHTENITALQFRGNSLLKQNISIPFFHATVNKIVGNIKVLNVGKFGACILEKDKAVYTSNLAIDLLLRNARKSIYIAQQSLSDVFNTWPNSKYNHVKHTNFIKAIAGLILKKGDVFIVTSPVNKNEIKFVFNYNSLDSYSMIWEKIKKALIEQQPNLHHFTQQQIESLLCKHLHLGTTAFNQNSTRWADNHKIYQHYKFIMVDSRYFYVGSQNFYPDALQDYGFIIDSSQDAKIVKQQFWEPLWKYSSFTEYRDQSCQFDDTKKSFSRTPS